MVVAVVVPAVAAAVALLHVPGSATPAVLDAVEHVKAPAPAYVTLPVQTPAMDRQDPVRTAATIAAGSAFTPAEAAAMVVPEDVAGTVTAVAGQGATVAATSSAPAVPAVLGLAVAAAPAAVQNTKEGGDYAI